MINFQSPLLQSFQQLKTKSIATGKNFGKIGGVYSAVECVIEKVYYEVFLFLIFQF